jgi:hypothetical protein
MDGYERIIGLNTKIIIKVNNSQVGVIQNISYKENPVSGSCDRIRFDTKKIESIFMHGYIHVASQYVPFNIVILDSFADDSYNITVIKNVWIRNIGIIFTASDFVVAENVDWEAECIYKF